MQLTKLQCENEPGYTEIFAERAVQQPFISNQCEMSSLNINHCRVAAIRQRLDLM